MVIPVAAILAGAEIASNIANVIQVGIMVNDALTPTLDTYEGRIETLDQATTAWQNNFIDFAPTAALDGFRSAIDYIKNGLFEAAQMQTSMIAASSDLATNLKIPIDDARKVIEDSQVAISEIAAALPGETAGYADIYRSISGTLSKQFSGDDFKKQSEEFTKRIGILAAIRGADAATAGNASNRFLAGTMGFGEAIVQDIFQRNPALYSALLEQLEVMKVDPEDWKNVQQGVRTKIFSAALAKAAPDALIAEFEGTFQGTIETIKTQVFDPIKGLFGIMRRIDSAGNRTVLDAANGVLQSLNNMKDDLVAIAQRLGLNLDPMNLLIQVFDTINDVVGRLHLAVLSGDPVGDLQEWISSMPDMIGNWIVSAVKYVTRLLDMLLGTGVSGKEIGSVIGQVMNLFENIKDKVLDNLDINQVAEIYFRVSKEIADAQGVMWWESVKILPTRLGNWFSELWLNLVIGLQPVRVMITRFVELMGSFMTTLNSAVELVLNPLSAVGKITVAAVTNDPNKPNPDSIGGVNIPFGGAIKGAVEYGDNLGKQLSGVMRPKPSKQAFAPNITVNSQSMSSAEEIAAMVQDKIYESYQQYQNESLA